MDKENTKQEKSNYYRTECECSEYGNGVAQIDAAIDLAFIHGGRLTFRPFEYCPWCGKKLIRVEIK